MILYNCYNSFSFNLSEKTNFNLSRDENGYDINFENYM